MSDPENFLTRWSRRKRDVADESGDESDGKPSVATAEPAADAASQPAPAADADALPFDLSRLPSIESIAADTDISGFLAPGVPAELKAAALRRAWVVDPKIKDFVGLNDYDFDFHTPGAIAGFGPLVMTDELRQEVARIVGALARTSPGEASSEVSEPVPPPAQPSEAVEEIGPKIPLPDAVQAASGSLSVFAGGSIEELQSPFEEMQADKDYAAPQKNTSVPENLQTPARRPHGGALPK